MPSKRKTWLIALLVSAVWVLVAPRTAWPQCEVAQLIPDPIRDGARFGDCVSVDGDVAVVGMPRGLDPFQGGITGVAVVFRRVNGVWQQEAQLTPTNDLRVAQFARSVAVSGNTVVVGAPFPRAAFVYTFNGNAWIQTQKLTAEDGSSAGWFGYAVAIAGDVIVVGAYGDDVVGTNSGSAYVFRLVGSTWVHEAKLTPPDGASGDHFGIRVAVHGGLVVAGSPSDDDRGFTSGSAYVFRFDGSGWPLETKLTASDGMFLDSFGVSVALGDDQLIVGASQGILDGRGSAYVFRFRPELGEWVETQKLAPHVDADAVSFGTRVAFSGDTALVASKSGTTGTAIFRFDGTTWKEAGRLPRSHPIVAIDGDTAVNGLPLDDEERGAVYAYRILGEPDCNLNGVNDACEDCDGNGVADECDIADGTSVDCNGNGIPDQCIELDLDCNMNGSPDACDLADGTSLDCNATGIADECDILLGTSGDCNNNLVPDECEIAAGTSPDCNATGIPDECEPYLDCNQDGVPDECQGPGITGVDCDANGVFDGCDFLFTAASPRFSPIDRDSPHSLTITPAPPATGDVTITITVSGAFADYRAGLVVLLNKQRVGDFGSIFSIPSCPAEPDTIVRVLPSDVYNAIVAGGNAVFELVPNEHVNANVCGNDSFATVDVEYRFDRDCNVNGVLDVCDIAGGISDDCTGNAIPDLCESDCNQNGLSDACEILAGTVGDCTANGIPDTCEVDCNANGIADTCDLDQESSRDCNGNLVPDECDIAAGTSGDCNGNGVPDGCEFSRDCNNNGIQDICDIADHTSIDVAPTNGIPDECDVVPGSGTPIWLVPKTASEGCVILDGGIWCDEGEQWAVFEVRIGDWDPMDIGIGIFRFQIAFDDQRGALVVIPVYCTTAEDCEGAFGAGARCDGASPVCPSPGVCECNIGLAEETRSDFALPGSTCHMGILYFKVDCFFYDARLLDEPVPFPKDGLYGGAFRVRIPPDPQLPMFLSVGAQTFLQNDSGTVPIEPIPLLIQRAPACLIPSAPRLVQTDSAPGLAQGESIGLARQRLIGITAGVAGRNQAIRVRFESLPPPWDVWNGTELWVTEPTAICELSGVSPGAACPTGKFFNIAGLSCDPADAFFTDWAALGELYLHHAGVVPGGVYMVQSIDETCSMQVPEEFSAPLQVENSRFGDAVAGFNSTALEWNPPDGRVDVSLDVVAALDAFANRAGNATKTRMDIEPCKLDFRVNITDVVQYLDAFSARPYPFAPGVGTCPSDPRGG